MARPVRCRRICFEPKYDSFSPCGIGQAEQVLLSVDEFETIRLIDHEKRTHEQCARQMGVSRTTVTEMYEKARSKIADCLVDGKTLCISGGNYALCDGSASKGCGKKCDRADYMAGRAAVDRKEAETMKIAVTYENGNVFPHFGHTGQFKVYEILDGEVSDAQVVDTGGSGHGALAGMLAALQVDTLICGGIGAGAQTALAEAGIQLYGGVSGSADEAVDALLAGKLKFDPHVHCDHHGHHGERHHHGEGHHCRENKDGCAGNGGKC
ncbi:MAG: DUF134 domain-containing protein [Lachnospiraceae bacterium]|nr:DUF134 domain-containing protein [Lachnospiraceae bacterium]